MAILAGTPTTAADLDAMTTASLALLQNDNELLPLQHNVNFWFHNLVAGTVATRRRSIWVPPYDYYLEALAVQASDQTAASTVEAAVTGDGTMTEDLGDNDDHGEEEGFVFWPVKVKQAAIGAGRTKLTRLLLDGTKGKPTQNFAQASQAFRTMLKGSRITVSARTTSVAAASLVQVTLVLRSFLSRGET